MGLTQLFSDPAGFLYSTLLYLPGIIIGLSFHEFAHAWMSNKLGDPTPRAMGRVTLNPLAHIDPIGMLMLVFLGFGYGKPVMVNPAYYKHRRRDEIFVALAGVTMNFIIAFVVYFLYALLATYTDIFANVTFRIIISYIVTINVSLMVFNLLPIPPLDGYKVIKNLFGHKNMNFFWAIEQYGFLILIALLAFGVTRSWIVYLSNAVMGFIETIIFAIFPG